MCELIIPEDLDKEEQEYIREDVHRALTVWYDENSGEVYDIDWSERFLDNLSLLVIDVLQDVMGMVETKYNEHHHNYFHVQLPESVIQLWMEGEGLTREEAETKLAERDAANEARSKKELEEKLDPQWKEKIVGVIETWHKSIENGEPASMNLPAYLNSVLGITDKMFINWLSGGLNEK